MRDKGFRILLCDCEHCPTLDDAIGDKVAGFGYLPQLDHYFR